ncbi:MAG: FISUMP domain-containing protein, partial [Chitinivibrionales bacterium]
SVTSNAAALTINTATSITTQPSAQSVCIGGGASFTVVAAGSGTLTYQWQKGGASISGATSPTYSIASVASGDAASYTCVVTGGCGPVTSNAAALSVNAATTVIDPTSIIRTIGTSASFTVTGSGAGTLSYQWEKNGSNISGATTATYTIGSVASADQGSYSCTVAGSCGAVTSNAATLTIQCSVTYNGNGNTSGTAPGTTNDNYNTDIVISNSGTLAKSGLVFVNWNTAADGSGTYYNAGSTLSKIQNNIILYAQWDVRDADGNHYDTVRINGVTWMVQNLRTTKLSNGNSLANVTDGTTWSGLTTPAYCWINNDSNTYKNPYGALYNWYASSASTLAPNGWHIATEQEWGYLDSYVNGDASGLKATGTTYWASPNSGATNSTGFSALGGGSRTNTDGSFYNFSYIGYWWTSTPVGDGQNAYAYYMNCNSTGIAEFTSAIGNGYSVRCVKN